MSKSTTRQDAPKLRYKVGSQAFFSCYPDFTPSDLDELELEEAPKLYKNFMQIRKKDGTRCIFKWHKKTADEFVEYSLRSKLPMEVGKFLVPEVAECIGFTIDHLKKLSPVFDRLDEKHAYERIIFDAYIDNGGFWLTQDQRDMAYQVYKSSR